MTNNGKKAHILIAEDDEALLNGVADLLEIHGFAVTMAINGADAMDKLNAMTSPPDLIISDIYMPIMDGYEFLKNVRENVNWVGVPFIFLTAKGEKEDIHEGFVRGAEDYLTKPFEFDDLVQRVRSRLRRHRELMAVGESRLEKLRQRILTVLNHELRTPLSYIVAYSDLMVHSESLEKTEELRQYISGIMNGTDRLSRLVESFLTLAELETGTGDTIFNRRRTKIERISSVLDEAITHISWLTSVREVSIVRHYAEPLPCIMGDTIYLEVAVRHLLENAVKFSHEGAKVDLYARPEGDRLLITVKDYGRGIAEEEQKNLYQLFYQINREEHEQQGIGAGLSIVKHVMRLHEGDVTLKSTEGQGASFSLSLPTC